MCSRSMPAETVQSGSARPAYIWSLTLRDLLLIALVAALCMVAKAVLRIPIHVPGHSGVLWVALFIICRGLVDKRGAGILLGGVAGMLAQFMGFGDVGPLEWTKWLAAGIVLEVLTLIVPGDLRSFPKAIIIGAALHLGKLAALTLARSHPPGAVRPALPRARLLGHDARVLRGAGRIPRPLGLRELRKNPALDAQARGQ